MLRRCLAISVGAFLVGALLLAAGVPGAVLIGIAPAVVCAAMHLSMAHGDADGRDLLATARRSARHS